MPKLPISEPEKPDEAQESKIRALIERHAAYAESGPTFDPRGTYLCGDCSAKSGKAACLLVSGDISFTDGSCRLWTTEPMPDQRFPKKLSQIEASYAERPKAKGFGCSRCEYVDGTWCGFWGLHIKLLACCSEEDGPDLIVPSEVNSNEE